MKEGEPRQNRKERKKSFVEEEKIIKRALLFVLQLPMDEYCSNPSKSDHKLLQLIDCNAKHLEELPKKEKKRKRITRAF